MKLIYIAGPYRGANAWEVEQNIRRAEQIGFEVASAGAIPLIPHTMYRFWDGTLDDSFWLACGIELLERCGAMVCCPGWGASRGTLAERDRALAIEIPIFHFDGIGDELPSLRTWLTTFTIQQLFFDDVQSPPGPGKTVSLSTTIKANASMMRKAKQDQ